MKYLGRQDYEEGSSIPPGFHWGYVVANGNRTEEFHPFIEGYISLFVHPAFENSSGKRFLFVAHTAWSTVWGRQWNDGKRWSRKRLYCSWRRNPEW